MRSDAQQDSALPATAPHATHVASIGLGNRSGFLDGPAAVFFNEPRLPRAPLLTPDPSTRTRKGSRRDVIEQVDMATAGASLHPSKCSG
jgi:hypothetical protein